MRRTHRIWWLLAVLTSSASCTNCFGVTSSDTVLRVRWPVSFDETKTKPTVSLSRLPSTVTERPPLAVKTGRALLLDDPGPGVRVREGAAHDLRFLEVVFGEADFDDPLPLVVLLHGRGDRPRLPGGPFSGAPTPMRLVIPQGPIPLGEGFTWINVSITHNRHDLLAAQLRKRADHIAALINTLKTTRSTLGRPIVAGFSQGGMLSFTLALYRPDAVGVALPLAGWVPPKLMPSEPVDADLRVPIRAVHGSSDPIIPMLPTRDVMERLGLLGWVVEFVSYAGVEHVMSAAMNEQFEAWLEEALLDQAPSLAGKGLGQPGPETAPYEPYESLDDATQAAIHAFDQNEPLDDVDAGEPLPEQNPGARDAAANDAAANDAAVPAASARDAGALPRPVRKALSKP